MKVTTRRWIATLMSLFLFGGSITLSTAQAAMVGNNAIFAQAEIDQQRQQLRDTLARDDVRAQMLELGADPAAIDQRIDNLTLAELQSINGQLEELPAGAGVGGLLVLLLLVFIITDALGATDIFTFIKPVR